MTLPLISAYPALKDIIPYKKISNIPTPATQIESSNDYLFENETTIRAWVKRDDISHKEYGGNKIRKLEFIIADAIAKNKSHIITFGAIGTNHGVATAMLCKESGLDCTIYLFDQPVTPTVQQNIALMHYYGAHLIYCGSLLKTALSYYSSRYRANRNSYFLFAGGSNIPGTLSFVNAAFELKNQIDNGDIPTPNTIICPVGSSATLAGLTIGCQLAGIDTKVKGIRVAPAYLGPFAACTEQTVSALMFKTQKKLKRFNIKPTTDWKKPILIDDYYGNGYGEASPEGQAAQTLMAHMGIKAEQTYTAKAAAAFFDELEINTGHCLYWNTYNSRDMSKQVQLADTSKLSSQLQLFMNDMLIN